MCPPRAYSMYTDPGKNPGSYHTTGRRPEWNHACPGIARSKTWEPGIRALNTGKKGKQAPYIAPIDTKRGRGTQETRKTQPSPCAHTHHNAVPPYPTITRLDPQRTSEKGTQALLRHADPPRPPGFDPSDAGPRPQEILPALVTVPRQDNPNMAAKFLETPCWNCPWNT